MQSFIENKCNWLIWCVENGDGKSFTAYGSSKLSILTVEADYHFDRSYSIFSSPFASGGFSLSPDYNLTTSMRGFIVVTGKTELEAIFFLLTELQEEEKRGRENEELVTANLEIRKLKAKEEKKRHKKTMKRRKEGKFDANYCLDNCSLCEEASGAYGHDDGWSEADYYYGEAEEY